MPFAHNGQISQDPIEGGIVIDEAQYQAALEGMLEGKVVSIEGGFSIKEPPLPEDPELPPEESGVPQVVSRFQARAALYLANFLDDVETIMADPETDMLIKLAWTDAQVFKRQSPTILSIAPLLNLNDEDIDNLFITAASLDA